MISLRRSMRNVPLPVLLFVTMLLALLTIASSPTGRRMNPFAETQPLIIVITPTYKRPTRLADMTRFANTLRLVPDVHWIVVEDGNTTVPFVENVLRRSSHSYTYYAATTPVGYPRRGWYQRTSALTFLRNNADLVMGTHKEGVVYFGDDDNSYDTRLFTDYIRHVKKLGMWAVGIILISL
ncbi:glycosyltransferase family 43 [Oesophagostomum dentatum]|uniref:Galactosylgalactosylxylosylprotein 3-beta-glucuronosyltransferase n=1 Tax=Oesophagostomum dentatum TaxID=61180 RepID=A0A0B1T3F6_OESDE|nr:glycosyltransferase family 43 [Oesophagostomum dentatum]